MTPAQITSLRAKVLLDQTAVAMMQDRDTTSLRDYLNAPASPAYKVWRSSTDAATVSDSVVWSSLTPNDTADGTAAFTNRALVCQAKQINLQILLQGQTQINSAKSNIRAGFQDALTNVPSGAGGAPVNAGWPAVKAAMTRAATLAEKLVATGTGSDGSPANLDIDGELSDQDVNKITFHDDGTVWTL